MSTVHSPSNPSATSSDASTLMEGIGFPSALVRTEVARLLQHEQEKAVALLEASPLLSYLFLTHVVSAKMPPDSPVSDHSEELSALKLRSEKLESELTATQVALTAAHNMVESLHEEVLQVKADMAEIRSKHTAVLEEKEGEKEDLLREAQKYKSEGEALQKITASQQLEMVRTKQQDAAEKSTLQSRLNKLQRQFDDLSGRYEEATTLLNREPEEDAPCETPQTAEHPSTTLSQLGNGRLTPKLGEVPTTPQGTGSPDVASFEPQTPRVSTLPEGSRTPDQSSPVRLSKAQKFKAKRIAKKRAHQEEATTRTEVMIEAS